MEDTERTQLYTKTRKIHPKKRYNFLFHFFFCWELPVVIKGWRKDLSEDDMYHPLTDINSKRLGDKFDQLWQKEEIKKKPSLLLVLIQQFALESLMYAVIYFPADLAVILFQPQFLIKLLNFYAPNQKNTTFKQALIYSSIVVSLALIRVLFFHWFILQSSTIGLKARIALSSLIYRRTLNLKKTSFQKVTTGQIVNLLSNDVYRMDSVFAYIHFLWISPIETIAAAFFLDLSLGHIALSGIGIILICLILQTFMSKKISHCRKEVASKTDYRIRLINDIVIGIQVIKMYTWEKTFVNLISTARNLEMKKIKKSLNFRVVNNSLRLLYTRLSIYICILIMLFYEIPLTSQFIFGLINSYEFLKISTIIYVPLGVTLFSEAKISINRIQKFLLTQATTSKMHQQPPNIQTKNKLEKGIFVRDLSLKWESTLTHNTLTEVTLTAISGEVIGVVGAAGSGKSTLLQAILQEIDYQKGTIEINGKISYAGQEPWVFPASIKQNILFGEEMNLQKYQKVTKVCALEQDFSLFSFGDRTLVGDRGLMLSGGQKARINLARTVYRDADIYLLDDPLSAVDAHVAEHIFKECILGYLKQKCVVLVTHQVQFLENLKTIYFFKNGKVEKVTADQLEFVKNNTQEKETISSNVKEVEKYNLPLEIKEHRSTTNSSFQIYKNYFLANGSLFQTLSIVTMLLISQTLANSVEYFVAFLVNLNQEQNYYSYLKKFFTPSNCAYIYTALVILFITITYTGLRFLIAFCLKASKNLHNSMLTNIVYGTMEFFNHHSAGRILNRFSKDMGTMDETIPLNLTIGITMTLMLLGICTSICILNYYMIPPTIILLIVIACYGIGFQPSTKNIKRTEAITKSVVFTHTMASIQGLTTIRAFNKQKILQKEFDNHMNLYSSAYYMLIALYNTLTFWTDLTCVLYTCLVVFSFFFWSSKMYVGYIGLAITQSVSLVGLFQYGMRTWSELDSQMTSVERIIEYSKLSPEKDKEIAKPPKNWSVLGQIVFNRVTMQYPNSTNPQLKTVTFEIQAGEKIGVVGRTGAGKSSLVSALFRLFDFDGTITIDDIDTKSIPLEILRSKISIIPQDPVLFLGTLRQNVDPYNEFSDSQLWNALEEVELKKMVTNWTSGLDNVILEGGSNISVGQRQLLCLMRAILKNSKIIILDEATANVDLKTDQIIQNVIRRKFKECTVLTIAHRLNTIMDSDKILVMDAGKVVEFGPPKELLQNSKGHFFSLVKSTNK